MDSVLIFVSPVCKNTDGTYEYDFFFSDTPEFAWGPAWDINTPNINGNMCPEESTYKEICRVKTTLPLKTYEETSCYSIEYATYRIFGLAWIDIENLEEYPEKGRLTMFFGEPKESIEEKLSIYDWKIINTKQNNND